jgi:hypothetical protein
MEATENRSDLPPEKEPAPAPPASEKSDEVRIGGFVVPKNAPSWIRETIKTVNYLGALGAPIAFVCYCGADILTAVGNGFDSIAKRTQGEKRAMGTA